MSHTKQERVQHANDLIKAISQHGRRFFWNEKAQRTATLELDARGKVWLIDDYRGARVFTEKTSMGNRWKCFSHGGTLRSLIEQMRDYIKTGQQIRLNRIAPSYASGCGDLWGYGEPAASSTREAAGKLLIIDATESTTP